MYHTSVLLHETIDMLEIKSDGIYVDGTLGGAGHTLEIAKRLSSGRIYSIDRDREAIEHARERLSDYSCFTPLQGNFKDLKGFMKEEGISGIDGCLFDLGVSSHQIDCDRRGFSYMRPGPLDMRMDGDSGQTAADIVNTYDLDSLIRIFKEYGEERFAKKIAQRIVDTRGGSPIMTTEELNDIIISSVPKNQPGGHPAKRVYQALRIEVNEELTGLYDFFLGLPDIVKDGGRIAVITFHSLEDRIVKQAFKKLSDPCECPKEFPVCVCKKKPKGKIITRKPILPSVEEMEANSRSKSAKLRVFEVCNERN